MTTKYDMYCIPRTWSCSVLADAVMTMKCPYVAVKSNSSKISLHSPPLPQISAALAISAAMSARDESVALCSEFWLGLAGVITRMHSVLPNGEI